MAWKYDNKVIRAGRSWTDSDGITHPSNWMQWTDSEKISAGMVYEADPAPFDSRYYFSAGIAKPLFDSTDGTTGLITAFKDKVTEVERSRLYNTDWLVLRSLEDSTYSLDSTVSTYRSDVRLRADIIRSALDSVSVLSELISLNDSADSGQSSFINTWPIDSSE